MIMPNSVSAERNLCAQIAATASLRVSMNFTVQLLRVRSRYCCNWEIRVQAGGSTDFSRCFALIYKAMKTRFLGHGLKSDSFIPNEAPQWDQAVQPSRQAISQR